MNKAWADRELREARRIAAMTGAKFEEPTNEEDDTAAQAAEHQRLAAFCRKLKAI